MTRSLSLSINKWGLFLLSVVSATIFAWLVRAHCTTASTWVTDPLAELAVRISAEVPLVSVDIGAQTLIGAAAAIAIALTVREAAAGRCLAWLGLRRGSVLRQPPLWLTPLLSLAVLGSIASLYPESEADATDRILAAASILIGILLGLIIPKPAAITDTQPVAIASPPGSLQELKGPELFAWLQSDDQPVGPGHRLPNQVRQRSSVWGTRLRKNIHFQAY
jgi:hypothetical protein